MVLKPALKRIIKRMFGLNKPDIIVKLKQKGLKVGANFHMQQGCIIDDSHSNHIEIGNDVSLAPNVHILAHDASTWWLTGYTKLKNTRIGNTVFIGAGTIVMPGVTIGNNVVIGAGSLVTKDVPDNCVYAGNPARFLMHTDAYAERERQKMNAENVFGEEFSERNNVSLEDKELMKKMADKYGTAYLK